MLSLNLEPIYLANYCGAVLLHRQLLLLLEWRGNLPQFLSLAAAEWIFIIPKFLIKSNKIMLLAVPQPFPTTVNLQLTL